MTHPFPVNSLLTLTRADHLVKFIRKNGVHGAARMSHLVGETKDFMLAKHKVAGTGVYGGQHVDR